MKTIKPEGGGCRLCPRLCGVRRGAGKRGVCGADDRLIVARAALHFWEEPPISGTRGSGTVFFSNCSLRCSYCQNREISRGKTGKAICVERLAGIFLELQEQGAHNINLVTPTHYVEQIIEALDLVHGLQGPLTTPIVYNTGGYELPETIEMLADHIDIYLTDFKYASAGLAARYSQASDYPDVAFAALRAMVAQCEQYELDDDGILKRGVIVRHLLLPGQLEDSKRVLDRAFEIAGNKVCYSLMSQFTPLQGAPDSLRQRVAEEEYSELIDFALGLGITNSFMQEGGAAEESFIPSFDLEGV
ncbi:MAG TPA: radical SAM protein [Coriobacteriia bacterium]|nr:radical SAM protein [Coriobacteriia bacterium]